MAVTINNANPFAKPTGKPAKPKPKNHGKPAVKRKKC